MHVHRARAFITSFNQSKHFTKLSISCLFVFDALFINTTLLQHVHCYSRSAARPRVPCSRRPQAPWLLWIGADASFVDFGEDVLRRTLTEYAAEQVQVGKNRT